MTKKSNQTMLFYTERELELVSGLLNLLEIEYTIEDNHSGLISAKEMKFKANESELDAIGAVLKVNWERCKYVHF